MFNGRPSFRKDDAFGKLSLVISENFISTFTEIPLIASLFVIYFSLLSNHSCISSLLSIFSVESAITSLFLWLLCQLRKYFECLSMKRGKIQIICLKYDLLWSCSAVLAYSIYEKFFFFLKMFLQLNILFFDCLHIMHCCSIIYVKPIPKEGAQDFIYR